MVGIIHTFKVSVNTETSEFIWVRLMNSLSDYKPNFIYLRMIQCIYSHIEAALLSICDIIVTRSVINR